MSQAEVGGVVTEEYAEPSRAIFSDPATNDDAAQGDRLAITMLQTQQARTVTAGISARQVTYLQPLHPDRHRASVIRTVILGNQHRIDGVGVPAHQASADPPDATDLARVEDASAEVADEARQLDPAATFSVQSGSTGKGAAGPGIELVLHVVEEVLNDGASVFAWGMILWAGIGRVRRRGDRRVQVQDPKTLGFLASSAKPDHEHRLAGAELVTTVCLTGGGPDMGTDLRDVWATSFLLPSGDVWVLFSAPDGGILGEVTVPARWTPGRGEIEGEEVARTYASLNIDRTHLG